MFYIHPTYIQDSLNFIFFICLHIFLSLYVSTCNKEELTLFTIKKKKKKKLVLNITFSVLKNIIEKKI